MSTQLDQQSSSAVREEGIEFQESHHRHLLLVGLYGLLVHLAEHL
jgi:hypothetical protein